MKAPTTSCRLYGRAVKSIPGGVNSPVRACKSVGADPLFIQSAEGAVIVDADGNRYIDYIGSWGPMILGHRHPAVIAAIRKRARARHELRRAHGPRDHAGGDGDRRRCRRSRWCAWSTPAPRPP